MDVMRLVDDEFFSNGYKHYIDYTKDEIDLIKKYFIKGMLKLYTQLSDLNEFDSLEVHINCDGDIDKYYIYYGFYIKSIHEEPFELKNIIDVIQYIHALCDYIPISYISKILKNDEVIYSYT